MRMIGIAVTVATVAMMALAVMVGVGAVVVVVCSGDDFRSQPGFLGNNGGVGFRRLRGSLDDAAAFDHIKS